MKSLSRARRAPVLAALLLGALAACNPSVPRPVDQDGDDAGLDAASATPDGGSDAMSGAIDAGLDAAPQRAAIQLLSGGGQASAGSLTLDVQIGIPTAGASADGARDLTTAPVLR
jgi:hypothetical protein